MRLEHKLGELKNKLLTSMILVVDDLKDHGIKTPSGVQKNHIFLDRSSWNTVDGLLSDKLDPRFEILHLLANVFDLRISEQEFLRFYASLPFYTSPNNGENIHATPWCPLRLSIDKIEKIPETFVKTSDSDPEDLRINALNICEKGRNLKECRVIESSHGGFATWTSYKVTVQGLRYKTVKLSTEEQTKQRCLELQRCSILFELAPTGQVSSLGFSSLDEQINLNCH